METKNVRSRHARILEILLVSLPFYLRHQRICTHQHTLSEVSFEYQALWLQTGFYFLTTCLVYRWQILRSRKHVIEEYRKCKKE